MLSIMNRRMSASVRYMHCGCEVRQAEPPMDPWPPARDTHRAAVPQPKGGFAPPLLPPVPFVPPALSSILSVCRRTWWCIHRRSLGGPS